MPGMSRELRLLLTARTTALRLYTRQANRFVQDLRGNHEPEVLNDAERVVNRLYTDAADAHDRWIVAAGADKEAPINIAWMDGLRGKHNQCMAAIDRARSGNSSGQTTDWLVDDQPAQNAVTEERRGSLNNQRNAPENSPVQTSRIADDDDRDGGYTAQRTDNALNSTPVEGGAPRPDPGFSTGPINFEQTSPIDNSAPRHNAGMSEAQNFLSAQDDTKRRRLEAEFQLAQKQREQERELEDLKRKQERERQDLVHRLQFEQHLSTPAAGTSAPVVSTTDAQVPVVSSAFARIQLANPVPTIETGAQNPFAYEPLSSGFRQQNPTLNFGFGTPNPFAHDQPNAGFRGHRTKLPIVVFAGDCRFWNRFAQSFNAAVSGSREVDSYLVALLHHHLSDDVRRRMGHLFNGSYTFSSAWAALEARYGRPELIIQAHAQHLAQVQPFQENDLKSLTELAASVRDAVSSVPSNTAAAQFACSTVVAQLVTKLPTQLGREWGQFARKLSPKVASLLDFDEWINATVEAEELRGALACPTATNTRGQSFSAGNSGSSAAKSATVSRGAVQHGPTVLSSSVAAGSNRWPSLEECGACKAKPPHRLEFCEVFKKMLPSARAAAVAKGGYCFKCLMYGHLSRTCESTSRPTCKDCNKPHHPLLHGAERQFPVRPTEGNRIFLVRAPVLKRSLPPVLLAIVPVTVKNGSFSVDTCAVLDPGSEATLITRQLADNIRAEGKTTTIRFGSFNQSTSMETSIVEICVAARAGSYKFNSVDAYVVPELRLSPRRIDWPSIKQGWEHLSQLDLPPVDSETVQVLVGADVAQAHQVLDTRQQSASEEEGPTAKLTPFGWTVCGKIPSVLVAGPSNKSSVNLCATQGTSLIETVEHFFRAESFKDQRDPESATDDSLALDILKRSAKFIGCGWQTDLLLKTPNFSLPDNRKFAVSRFYATERRLLLPENKGYLEQYIATVDKLIERGYLVQVPPSEVFKNQGKTWILPHTFVLYPNKPGRIRVVLDARARYQGVCLNDLLLRGPVLLSSMVGVLLRSREFTVAITGDIEAFYHRISVTPEQRSLLRFLWRVPGSNGPLITHEMTSHVFGARDSATIASWVLELVATLCTQYPEVAARIKHNFYADNMCDSFETEAQAIEFIRQVTHSLASGGFRLTGFASSSRRVVNTVPPTERAASVKDLDLDQPAIEYLFGSAWHIDEDVYRLRVHPVPTVSTRREMLAAMARTFDPLGICLPVTTYAKRLFQLASTNKPGWDSSLPSSLLQRWNLWAGELHLLSSIFVPRCFRPPDFPINECVFTLVVFGDSSLEARGAVAYLRAVCGDRVSATFVLAKGRLSPLRKPLTIPRLELEAAVLAVELAEIIKSELRIPINDTVFYSDSTITLCRIKSPPPESSVEGRRIKRILTSSTAQQWRFVPSGENPADECTRGTTAAKFCSRSKWIQGPEFLRQLTLPSWSESTSIERTLPHEPTTTALTTVNAISAVPVEEAPFVLEDKMKEVSKLMRQPKVDLTTLKRQVAAALKPDASPGDDFTATELKEAFRVCLLVANKESYPKEYAAVSSGRPVANGSRLRRVTPFIAQDGILRVTGRLEHAEMPEHARFPTILDADHPLTPIIIADVHKRVEHGGVERTLGEVRWEYYLPQGRRAVRKTLARCRKCKLERAMPQPPFMAPLPKRRLEAFCPPFTNVGLDFFGPFYVVIGRRREKRYGLLITCLSTRAVHLEVVFSLSANSFLMALRRFIADRGRPQSISSDNGTNLTAGEKELKQGIENLNSRGVTDPMADLGIEWIFNPPSAPHFGGAWERLVQSAKRSLRSTLENRAVTDEVLHTVFKETASLMNGRPLTNVCTDPNEPEPLTPNHFLFGRHHPHIPADVEERFDGLSRNRWKQCQFIIDQFWRRWMREYVPTLTERHKWNKKVRPLKVGDEVLILDENTRRGEWLWGSIVEIFPDSNGVVRKAAIKTSKGTYTRPAVKLCLLSVDADD